MNVTIFNDNSKTGPFSPLLPADKSLSHRALIAASLAGGGCRLFSLAENDDVKATAKALKILEKVRSESFSEGIPVIDCGESASTLRFLLPLFAQTGKTVLFTGKGRLLSRPLGPYEKLYSMRRTGNGIEVSGTLKPGNFTVPGDISSQFISGLLFVLPLLDGDSTVTITAPYESAAYVDLTLQILALAGIETHKEGLSITVPGRQQYRPFEYAVPADWSAAANILALAFLTGKDIRLCGSDMDSLHPDRAVTGLLEELRKGPINADISGSPDLGPLLFALAAQTRGTSTFTGAGRLRIKESDRVAAMQEELAKLGCRMDAGDNGTVKVHGRPPVKGGVTLSAHGDHRIAMALAVLACSADAPVTIEGAECVSKSWPDFFETLISCGITIKTLP